MVSTNSLYGRLDDPARDAGYVDPPARKGFFTDTSVCIGCKACEVACKEWNAVPEDGIDLLGLSYDNTGGLGADSWRAVAFIEQSRPAVDRLQQDTAAAGFDAFAEAARLGTGVPGGHPVAERAYQNSSHGGCGGSGGGCGSASAAGRRRRTRVGSSWHARHARARAAAGPGRPPGRALADDVQRLQALHARGLPRRVPHRALFRTEFGTVVVQQDVCNGCGYCVSACPYGVIDKREDDGRAWKCTLCYDRLGEDETPAARRRAPRSPSSSATSTSCANAPNAAVSSCTTSASPRPGSTARTPTTGSAGTGLLPPARRPEVYGLPPDPVVTTRDLPSMYKHMAAGRGLHGARHPGGCAGAARVSPKPSQETRTSPASRVRARPRHRPDRRAGRPDVGRRHGATGGAKKRRGDANAVVPDAEFRSYYGRAVLKPPVWTHEIAYYLFSGGLAAGCSMLAAVADARGDVLARRALRTTSLGAVGQRVLPHRRPRPSRTLLQHAARRQGDVAHVGRDVHPLGVRTVVRCRRRRRARGAAARAGGPRPAAPRRRPAGRSRASGRR